MAATRVYSAEDALTVTAFPLADDLGYVIRLGDHDTDGVYLGAVFHEQARWVAFAPAGADGRTVSLGSNTDLDELVTECFLDQLRLPDESEP